MRIDSIHNHPQKHKLPTYALLATRVRKVMTLDGPDVTFVPSGGTGSVLGICVCPVQKKNGRARFVDQRNDIIMFFFA